MISDAITLYMESLVAFWQAVVRVGNLRLILVVVALWWFFRRGGRCCCRTCHCCGCGHSESEDKEEQ